MDFKRITYLLSLALVIGLALVHLRTAHIQTMNKFTRTRSAEQPLRQEIWEQQALLSKQMESPRHLQTRIKELDLPITPPGQPISDDLQALMDTGQ